MKLLDKLGVRHRTQPPPSRSQHESWIADDTSTYSYSTYSPRGQRPVVNDFPAPHFATFFYESYFEGWQRSSDPRVQRPKSTFCRPGRQRSSSSLSFDAKIQGDDPLAALPDQSRYLPARQLAVACVGLSLSLFLAYFDSTVLSAALPTISNTYEAGRHAAWLVSSYLLTSTATQPILGRLSDLVGRKDTLIMCLAVYIIGSLGCALARSIVQLIVLRAVAGIGGGGLIACVLITMSDICSLRQRGRYMAILEIAILVALGLGPPAGGMLATVNYRLIFGINAPLGALSIVLVIFFVPLKRVRGRLSGRLKQLDLVGAALILVASTLVLLGLNFGGVVFPWSSPVVICTLLGGGATAALLAVWESRFAELPIIPYTVFQHSTTIAGFLGTFLGNAAFFTQLYYLPQFAQIVLGKSPLESGLYVIPMLVCTALSVTAAGLAVAWTGKYLVSIVGGYMLWAVALGLLSIMDRSTSEAKFMVFSLLAGVGRGQTPQTTVVAMQAAVPRHEASAVLTMRSTVRELGSMVALSACGAILNNAVRRRLEPLGFSREAINSAIDRPTAIHDPDLASPLDPSDISAIIGGWEAGFRTVFRVFAALMAVSALMSLLLIRQHSLTRDDDAQRVLDGQEWRERVKMRSRSNSQLGQA